MLHVWIIALVAVLAVHDGRLISRDAEPPSWLILVPALLPMVVLILLGQLVSRAACRALDTRGDMRSLSLMRKVQITSNVLAVILHAGNIWVLGLLDFVRASLGDWVLLDEVLVLLPPLAVFVSVWWAQYPIELRMHNALFMRTLDDGQVTYELPSRQRYILLNVRHQLLFTLTPILLLLGWSEAVQRGLNYVNACATLAPTSLAGRFGAWLGQWPGGMGGAGGGGSGEGLAGGEGPYFAHAILQLVAVAAVFMLSPLLIRSLWDTAALAPGPLRDQLLAVCTRARVRVRDIRIWHTGGMLVNAAAIGVLPFLRTIILSDRLLNVLPARQVESVMAHETAHVRFAHIPWLCAAMFAGLGLASIASNLILATLFFAVLSPDLHPVAAGTIELALTLGMLVPAILVFGVVSRRFEWQADAYAASQSSDAVDATSPFVAQSASEDMSAALGTVANYHHMNIHASSFRHGSIATRQQRLYALIGQPRSALPIDRTVRRIKLLIICGLIITGAAIAWDLRQIATTTPPIPAASSTTPPAAPPSTR